MRMGVSDLRRGYHPAPGGDDIGPVRASWSERVHPGGDNPA